MTELPSHVSMSDHKLVSFWSCSFPSSEEKSFFTEMKEDTKEDHCFPLRLIPLSLMPPSSLMFSCINSHPHETSKEGENNSSVSSQRVLFVSLEQHFVFEDEGGRDSLVLRE